MTAAVIQSTSLADSISSQATAKTMNTTKLPGRKSSTTTALTVPNGVNANKTSTTTPAAAAAATPSSTKRPRTELTVNGELLAAVPIERRPLPSARELSKVLCRIVDDEAYSERDAEIALETLHHWALKQNVAFGNHFADVGGLQQVLFFVEDRIDDCNCIAPALMLMETLCKPLQGASHTIYESKALSNMRTKIGKCIVDVGGVHLMLRTFQWHALPNNNNSNNISNSNSSKTNKTSVPTTSSSSSSQLSKDNSAESGMWTAFKTMMNTPNQSLDEVLLNPCACADGFDPMTVCYGGTSEPQGPLPGDLKLQKIATARHSMEVLVLLIPHVIGVDKTAPGKILETLCDGIPILLNEMKNANASQEESQKEREALVASVLTCLVATTSVASKETFTHSKLQKAKQVVSVTNLIMRTFHRHHGINRDGCLVLQRVCRHLPKSERKRLGVVASLGSVVASESIDQDVKDIADEILEEQFK